MSDDIIDDSSRTAFNDKIAGLESDIKSITKLVMSGTLPLGSSATTAPNQSMITSSVINTAFTRHFDSSKFQGLSPQETDNFIGLADSFYRSYIFNRTTKKPDKEKESFYLSCLRAHLDVAPSRAIGEKLDACESFLEAKQLIEKNYGGRLNHLLVISEASAIEFDTAVPMHDYAGKVQTKLNEAFEASSKEFKRVNPDKEMTAQDCFNIFATHMLTEKLRLNMPDLYNLLIDRMKDIFRADDLAAAAESLRRNMTPTEGTAH
jgi:hypothetical protein